MKQIQLVGPVDKRAVAYPLFKLCDVLGKTLVVTDDANFRRFADNYENEFTVGRSDFYVVNDVSQAIVSDLGLKLNAYDYVIFITTNILIDNNDVLVYCHGNSRLVCGEDVIDYLENLEHSDVTISTRKPKSKESKDDVFLTADGKIFGYVWDCEEAKRFIPCGSPDLVKLCSHLFSQTLGVSAEEMPKVIGKEV